MNILQTLYYIDGISYRLQKRIKWSKQNSNKISQGEQYFQYLVGWYLEQLRCKNDNNFILLPLNQQILKASELSYLYLIELQNKMYKDYYECQNNITKLKWNLKWTLFVVILSIIYILFILTLIVGLQ